MFWKFQSIFKLNHARPDSWQIVSWQIVSWQIVSTTLWWVRVNIPSASLAWSRLGIQVRTLMRILEDPRRGS